MKTPKMFDEKALLKKNPEAAKVLAEYRSKLSGRPRRPPKDYALGLPYTRPVLISSVEDDAVEELGND